MSLSRKKIAIVIDYSIRIPNFKDCYMKCKSEIISGSTIIEEQSLSNKDNTGRSFWVNLHKKNNEEYEFYEKTPVPQENFGEGFDYSLKKYFFNDEHRLRFLDDWSFNLFGQGSITNSADINLINICQSKLCDVVLIDRVTHSRKIPNTLAFLSKSNLFVKEIRFVNKIEEIEMLKTDPTYLAVYDPFTDNNLVLTSGRTISGEPSPVFLNWLYEIEKKINNKK